MKNFSGIEFGNKAFGFDTPSQLPRDDTQRRQWQSANKTWWETTPMRYDWRDEITAPPGTESYFKEIDRRFLLSAWKYMPWQNVPFDQVIPFDRLGDKDVLEIGVGQGTHAQLLAPCCKSFTGIDLTSHAVEVTTLRLKCFNIPGKVVQMDAEEMGFADNSFDFIWSWGVIHHSADTRRVLQEMHRVLRPGGSCTVMVYYKSWWDFYVCGCLRRIFQRQFNKQESLHCVAQSATDGAIARYYTQREWLEITNGLFEITVAQIYGLKGSVVPLPHGRLKQFLEDLVPNAAARLLTNRLRGGSFLVAHMGKTCATPTISAA
jgi:ubiquinone/menaquinone biosynthesis C-methylase UbiE